ncbi:hypothetical protein QN277_018251 [Acacia crassicarpa]|uniref:Uncharacterized protein n=1 Tax=Acacia crassicarpa TaxID=499986 RepID=A0AAE1JU40_9FABA|nr:hypothetical protein QN277_018251 [Acacia crassicarpa]
MDKPRGVRRGPSRFSTAKLRAKQSGHKLCDGLDGIEVDFEFPLQTKKEKVRSLNAVGRALSSCQENKMGCGVTAKVGALRVQSPSSNTIASSKKRFKVSKRFSADCNGVGHASVPRKLRSAVKKRNREYSLLDYEKLNHKLNGIESPVKECIQKTEVMSMQQGNPDWSTRQTVSGPITKDEEEVVETLYALSGMFLNKDSNERLKLQGDSSPENSNLQDLEKSTNNNAFEGSGTAQDSHHFHAEISSGEAAITNSSVDCIDRKQPDSVENAELMTSDNFASNLNLDTMPMLSRNENGNEAALDDSELSLAVGLSMPRQSPNLRNEMKPEPAGAVESIQVHHMMKGQSNSGVPTWWPGLALAASAESQASYLQSSAAKAPVWHDAARCAFKQDSIQGASSEISEVVVHKKLWKRCAAHVHISNFIRNLQESNNKDLLEQANHSNQLMRANEGSVHGDLMEVQNSNRTRSEITSAPGLGHSDTGKDLHDNRNSIRQQSCCYHEALTPDVYGTQKQGLELLSLSAGGNGLKVNNKLDQSRGSRLESLPKLQMPYFQPLAQLQGLMPFPVPQSQYASPSYLTHQISAAGPQVLPHYYGNSLWPVGRNGSTASNNKHQQQSFWGVLQVATEGQGRSGINCNTMGPQYPKWENGRQGSVVNPAMIPQSSASVQVVGSKFLPISEQHQQHFLSLASSLPQSRTNGLNNFAVPPSACEQSRGRFHSSRGTASFQLLGDER